MLQKYLEKLANPTGISENGRRRLKISGDSKK